MNSIDYRLYTAGDMIREGAEEYIVDRLNTLQLILYFKLSIIIVHKIKL